MAGPWEEFQGKPASGSKPWEEFGEKAEKPKGPGVIRKAGDLAAGFVGGALGATKALTDVAGAGNAASNFLESANKDVDSLLSPQAQADRQEQSAIMQEAEGKGLYEGVKAGAKAFAVAPWQTAVSGLGSVVPTVAIGLATGGAGAVASRAAQVGSGLAMGAGTTKGAIYDDIKKRSLESGMTPEAAEAAATQAQSYGGENIDQIALGSVLGAADAATGVTPAITNMARQALGQEIAKTAAKGATGGILARTGKGILGEMPLEAAQGGQEQLASNIAAQRAGFQAGTWDNVASNATLEGLASAGPGGLFGALNKGTVPPVVPPVVPPAEAPPPTTQLLGHDPMAGTHTVFPDGSIVLNSESSNGAKTVRDMKRATRLENAADPFFGDPAPANPSEEMGLAPTAGPSLANAAILSVDSGIHQAATEDADPYNAPLSALGQELVKTNQRLRQESDALGLDTDGLHGDAARMTDGKSHEDYLMAANDQLRKAMKAAKELPNEGQRSNSADPATGGEAKGPDAQAGKAPAVDAGGPVRAGAVRPAVDRVGEHGQRAPGTDSGSLPGAVATPTRDQAIAKASDAAGKVLASGGTDADANRAATDSLIDQMANTPDIAIAQDAPAAVKAAKAKPPANNNAQTTTSAPAAPAAGLPAAGSAPVQAAGVGKGSSPISRLPNGLKAKLLESPTNSVLGDAKLGGNLNDGKSSVTEVSQGGFGNRGGSGVADNSLGSSARNLQGARNGDTADSKGISNLLSSESVRRHGFDGLNSDQLSFVKNLMLRSIHDGKVLRSVVGRIPVDVMNVLRRKQLSPEALFSDESVLKNVFSMSNGNPDVAISAEVFSSFVEALAQPTAIQGAGSDSSNVGGVSVKGKPALGANDSGQNNVLSASSDGGSNVPLPTNISNGTQASQTPSTQGAAPAGAVTRDSARQDAPSPEKQKALDRIASGKAWFGSGPKAQQFVAQNGLKDTHTVKKTGATRFDVVENETQPATQGATREPQAEEAVTPEARPETPAAAGAVVESKARTLKTAILREAGKKLADQGEADRSRDRNTNTARRARMAAGAEAEAAKREAMGKTMMNLADAIEAGKAPALEGITTRAAVETLDRALQQAMHESERGLPYAEQQRMKGRRPETKDIQNAKLPRLSWDSGGADAAKLREAIKGKRGNAEVARMLNRAPSSELLSGLKKLGVPEKTIESGMGWWNIEAIARIDRLARAGIKTDDDLRNALRQYVDLRDGPAKEDLIKSAERALVGQKVGFDYFPTPKAVAERMAEGIKPGMRVLEPSAGNGNLADAAKAKGATVDVVEISDTLRNVLEAKGYNIVARDFMDFTPDVEYDAILMNPPFSSRMDAAHIQRAYGMLKPGGTLSAIAGEGVFFGSDKKAVEFRDWLDSIGATVEKLPEGTFQDKTLQATTGTNARMIVVEKAAAKPVAVAKPEQTRTAIEHAGLKIYPIKVKMGDAVVEKWAVQTPDNARREKNGERQIGGDPLSDTLDEAKKNAESEVRTAKNRAEREAESKAADEAEQSKKDANKGKSLPQRRSDALLDKQHTYPPQAGLGQGTRREAMQKAVDQGRSIVERMVPDTAAKHRDQTAIDLVRARGYILGLSNENIPVVKQGLEAQARMKADQYEKPEYRVYDSAKTDGGFYEITKTEFDYAKSLTEKAKDPHENYIKSAADSIARLRKSDVYRVLDSLAKDNIDGVTREGLADYIKKNHPDYAQEVDDVLTELSQPTPATPVHQDPGEKPEAAPSKPTAEQIDAIGDITIEVPTETGTAKMTVNAAKALAHIDERMSALEMVKRCLG